MKFLAILAAMVAVTASYPVVKTWTLGELEGAIKKSEQNQESPDTRKYLNDAMNRIMYIINHGSTEDVAFEAFANLLSPTGSKIWTKDQLDKEFDNSDQDPALKSYIQKTYKYTMIKRQEDNENQGEVIVPAMDISTWTVADVEEALADPETNAALIPYLEKVKEEIKKAVENGETKNDVTLVTPVSLVKTKGVKAKFAGKKYS